MQGCVTYAPGRALNKLQKVRREIFRPLFLIFPAPFFYL